MRSFEEVRGREGRKGIMGNASEDPDLNISKKIQKDMMLTWVAFRAIIFQLKCVGIQICV